ncbi:helix-turn-helix domain-containing protein [Fournierella massiliensis]|nr:helix-turn-helix transcriptional regulator [Fournierella massiliensis]MCF2557062.1 helix-turn-helix domain-containing protein [Fournierella massiliensis]
MVNVDKLKGKIVEKRSSVEELSKVLGMDRSTLYRRFSNDGSEFTIREADLIAKALKLSGEEAYAIFFAQYVA